MTYCTDVDLLNYRPNILSLGVSSWETQRNDAFDYINRIIIARWYNQAAVKMGYDPNLHYFDPTLVKDDCLKRLECYKTLQFAYVLLMNESPEKGGFERNIKTFGEFFGDELDSVLANGVSYDWSGDGSITSDEALISAPRRLHRS